MNTMSMKQVENRVILIILFLQLGHPLGATLDKMLESKDHTNRRIMERLSFGKMWYVYIKANIFDIVVHTFHMRTEDSNTTSMSLYGAVKQMGRLKISRYPCQSLKISFNGSIFHDAIHEKGVSQLEFGLTKSKICGSISRNFHTVAPSTITQGRNDKDFKWLWQIHVNQHFIVNVTFLSLESRFYPPCITRRALIQETRGIDLSQKRILGVFCPNNPPQSFYSSGNNVQINVHTWYIYEDFFLENYYFNQWMGRVSFTYEILDNDLSLDPWTLLQRRWPSGKYEYFRHSKLTSIYYRELPSFHVAESFNNETNAYLFQFFESNGDIVFVFYFQSHLGKTIAIREGSLTCTKTKATLVAYEGPMVDMTRIESLLVHLQEWNCGHYMNASNCGEELKGRIGDMTILFLVDKASTAYFYSLILKVAFRPVVTNTSFALNQKIHLGTTSSISFEQKGTYFYVVEIQSVKTGFVNIYFDHISLRGYMDQSCTYGGLYITNEADIYNDYTFFVGALCSQMSASRFQRLYGRHGLTFNDYVTIYIKQYYLLFRAQVKLRFSLDQCLGLFNLRMGLLPFQYFRDEKGHVELIRGYFYGEGYNFYYRWFGGDTLTRGMSSIGIKCRNGTACCKVNYVHFDTIIDVVDGSIHRYLEHLDIKTIIGATREENVQPSRMSMAFWNMDEELKHFDKCLADAFRFYPDNQNNEPYVFVTNPEEDAWVTLSFTAKFGVDKRCLIFGGAYQFRVQEADGYSQCFSEVGGYLYDSESPLIPKGVCGGILVSLIHGWMYENNTLRLAFQRPLMHDRCCHLDMLVMSKSTPCIRIADGRRKTRLQNVQTFNIYVWTNRITTTSEMFTWRALCNNGIPLGSWWSPGEGFASDFLEDCIHMFFVAWDACDVNIHYRMSLLAPAYKALTTDSMFIPCRGNSCYEVIISYFCHEVKGYAMSWDDAQAECIKRNGSLVSVNSDAEWRYLTHNIIPQEKAHIELIYIGYRTVSNPSHNDRLLTSMNFLLLWYFSLPSLLIVGV